MNSYMENYILDINPIAFSVGPINVYWYGLAYMAGMVLGLFYALKIVETKKAPLLRGFLRIIKRLVPAKSATCLILNDAGFEEVLLFAQVNGLTHPWERIR